MARVIHHTVGEHFAVWNYPDSKPRSACHRDNRKRYNAQSPQRQISNASSPLASSRESLFPIQNKINAATLFQPN
ncbi:hypothetical protein ACP26C_07840 [Franconibacter helveticus 513]|uniref:hypothetical protein n=1 Tax=Franconibacter helveticus TaxID=357240 RepID=UPI0011131E42|nr:hypothetical protein [Franconibacter helveticus]